MPRRSSKSHFVNQRVVFSAYLHGIRFLSNFPVRNEIFVVSRYDSRVRVEWQLNAWADEKIIKHYLRSSLRRDEEQPKLLVLDVATAHKTSRVAEVIAGMNFDTAFIPPGTVLAL